MSDTNKFETIGCTSCYIACPKCGVWYHQDRTHLCEYSGYRLSTFKQGWECPKCHNVYAPHIDECKRCNSVQFVWTGS